MNQERIRDRYERFKEWQKHPHTYKLTSDEVHLCNNCGHEFTGNFCPICSQKAGMGRIGWRSVHQGIMDIWGLGTRSLLYSVWQLLWRPGHIISDYIDGKRQVSFPPVKMLFIIAVIYSMIFYWIFPDVLGISLEVKIPKEQEEIFGDFLRWSKTNYSWYALAMAMLAVFPTWVMFRYSPRHTRHSLPEGFFIQVFLAILMTVFSLLLIPLAMIDVTYYTLIIYFFYGVYYIIVYKYLFGYGLWGTLWRSGFVLLAVILYMAAGIFTTTNISQEMISTQMGGHEVTKEQIMMGKLAWAFGLSVLASIVLGVGFVINYFVTRKFRRELKETAMR